MYVLQIFHLESLLVDMETKKKNERKNAKLQIQSLQNSYTLEHERLEPKN